MKSLSTILQAAVARGQQRSNLRVLLMLVAVLTGIVGFFSVLFHVLMAYEGQAHSWVTGFYWTIVAMSTLGYGDILPVYGWRPLAPMTALNGIMLIGWSTALIIEVLRRTGHAPSQKIQPQTGTANSPS